MATQQPPPSSAAGEAAPAAPAAPGAGGPVVPLHRKKFLDLGSALSKVLSEDRVYRVGWREDYRDARAFHINPSRQLKRYYVDAASASAMPEGLVCSRYLHTAINKSRCPVNVAKWTPEGRWLVTGAMSGEFTLWNGLDFSYNRVIQGHDVAIRAMTWSHRHDYMVTGDNDGNVKVWNPSIRYMKALEGHTAAVRGLSFSPTDLRLASCSDDLSVRIWDFTVGSEERTMMGHGFDVKCVDWHPSKSLICSGSRDNFIKLWDPRSGRCLRSIAGHKATVNVVQWHPSSEHIFLSASRDMTVRLHDLRMIQEGALTSWQLDAEVHAAVWHPYCSELLVTGEFDGAMAFWIVGGGYVEPKRQAHVPAAHESAIWDLDWNPMGHMLASGSNDHTAKFWARPNPGDCEADLYRGYQKDVSEINRLRLAGVALPVSVEQKEQDRLARTPASAMAALAKVVIPGVGPIGLRLAQCQAGDLVLASPTDTALEAAKVHETTLNEQRRVSAMESISTNGPERRPRHNAGGGASGGNTSSGGHGNNNSASATSVPVSVADLPKPRYRGKVRNWKEEGYGFIAPFDPSLNRSVFAHATCIVPGMGVNGSEVLEEGAIVEFSMEDSENRKTGEAQLRAAHIISQEYFLPGKFEGYDSELPPQNKITILSSSRTSGGSSRPSSAVSSGPSSRQQQQQQQHHNQPPPQLAPSRAPPAMLPLPPAPQHMLPPPPAPQHMLPPELISTLRTLLASGQTPAVMQACQQSNITWDTLMLILGMPPGYAPPGYGPPPPGYGAPPPGYYNGLPPPGYNGPPPHPSGYAGGPPPPGYGGGGQPPPPPSHRLAGGYRQEPPPPPSQQQQQQQGRYPAPSRGHR